MQSDSYLFWLDLEMTGLDPNKETILEIASIITDNNLNIIAEGPNIIIHHSEEILEKMDPWCIKQHGISGLTESVRKSKTSLAEAEEQTFNFLSKYCTKNSALLCGNSVYVDRSFLQKLMPKIDQYLNYRIIDVTTVKELVRRWHPEDPFILFEKASTHRALEDVYESIKELQHYRRFFFRPTKKISRFFFNPAKVFKSFTISAKKKLFKK